MKKYVLLLVICLFLGCDNSNISIIIYNNNLGTILIDGDPIGTKIQRYGETSEEGSELYFLDLKKGIHKFEITIADGTKMIKTFNLKTGEAYLFIDLLTGESEGFE